FFFNDTATTEIYTLSLHDALPIFDEARLMARSDRGDHDPVGRVFALEGPLDRKSTRLNSSHSSISYDVFCLEKKSAGRGDGGDGGVVAQVGRGRAEGGEA